MSPDIAHLIRPTTWFRPDIAALRATPTRVVVAAGTTSKGSLPNRTAVALAGQLGTGVVDFPGDHGGFLAMPQEFAGVLRQVLTQTAGPAGSGPRRPDPRRPRRQ